MGGIGPVTRLGRLACLALLGTTAVGAQTPTPSQTPQPLTLEVEVEVVSITAVVRDKSGHFMSGLGPGDVEVFEDGVPQQVSYFREAGAPGERIPLSVALVLDTSGSMHKNLGFLQEAALSFVYKLEDVDQALVIQFNESVKASAEFTKDIGRLEQFIGGLQAWGGTSLYDAIHYGLNRVRDQPGRKAVVVFSDGADTTSTLKEQEVIDYARAVESTVYCIGIRGESGLRARSPRGFLRKIARETGGEFFFPDRVGELLKVFGTISDELHNHYLLGYSPKRAPDGTWRKIEVRVKVKDAEVRVRKGYFAIKRRREAPKPPAP